MRQHLNFYIVEVLGDSQFAIHPDTTILRAVYLAPLTYTWNALGWWLHRSARQICTNSLSSNTSNGPDSWPASVAHVIGTWLMLWTMNWIVCWLMGVVKGNVTIHLLLQQFVTSRICNQAVPCRMLCVDITPQRRMSGIGQSSARCLQTNCACRVNKWQCPWLAFRSGWLVQCTAMYLQQIRDDFHLVKFISTFECIVQRHILNLRNSRKLIVYIRTENASMSRACLTLPGTVERNYIHRHMFGWTDTRTLMMAKLKTRRSSEAVFVQYYLRLSLGWRLVHKYWRRLLFWRDLSTYAAASISSKHIANKPTALFFFFFKFI